MKLTPAGRTALWIGGGGFVGLAIGALITGPSAALALSPIWLILFAIFVGIVIGVARDKTAAPAQGKTKSVPVAGAASPRADALAVRIEFPDVPTGFPPVMGRGDPLIVKVQARAGGKPADAAGLRSGLSAGALVPAEGAAVLIRATMDGESLDGDGVTGSEGAVEFTLEPQSIGELRLTADVKSAEHVGAGSATISIVDYSHEIERLFAEFRAYAVSVLGPDAQADTARELADKLRMRSNPDAARALLELARVYELVAYGQRRADRRLYLAVMEQLMLLEHADMPEASVVPREA